MKEIPGIQLLIEVWRTKPLRTLWRFNPPSLFFPSGLDMVLMYWWHFWKGYRRSEARESSLNVSAVVSINTKTGFQAIGRQGEKLSFFRIGMDIHWLCCAWDSYQHFHGGPLHLKGCRTSTMTMVPFLQTGHLATSTPETFNRCFCQVNGRSLSFISVLQLPRHLRHNAILSFRFLFASRP